MFPRTGLTKPTFFQILKFHLKKKDSIFFKHGPPWKEKYENPTHPTVTILFQPNVCNVRCDSAYK